MHEVYDDCGDDVAAIDAADDTTHDYFTNDDHPLSDAITLEGLSSEVTDLETFMVTDHINESDRDTDYLSYLGATGRFDFPKEQLQDHTDFADFTNLGQYMTQRENQQYFDVVEIYGGKAEVTQISIRRNLRCGKNFDVCAGIDLTDETQVRSLFKYLQKH